ncbi:hypothetical protein M441DRAFT_45294 [Trichoderma asperellum CBS 433.97]|uniref:VWFA domain-containing protein n=1 Tax=Trichoderma asperellum (strain ATCC 204424 / CBS 433.97 / NBRC 101777) TaxID=1042311 RepID=A0A2T3ZEU5_TRIA4|nr:hypothetical protein M441DRAFT_45294 [Trichoderma asperellum CBS 433.97]PTB43337.1 hypothetical protein M441DRAFT_45294 [Trichoderma asperellum CBS 433.97]
MRRSSVFGSLRDKLRGESDKRESKKSLAPNNLFLDPNEAPPAYSALAPPVASGSAPPYLPHITSEDDKYAFLSSFDTIFVVDDSGSMAGHPWREVAEVLRSITPICTAHDKDGIDLYFLNHKSTEDPKDDNKPSGGYYGIDTPEKVQVAFQMARPTGATPTGTRLWNILNPYIAQVDPSKEKKQDIEKVKPINIIVITDGRPTDDPETVIYQCAKKLDSFGAPPHQVGIQFFQIGTDKDATEALRELDDELAKLGVRDMVDTVTWDGKSSNSRKGLTADGILKVVLGAVIRRLDRRPSANQSRR